MRSKRWLLCSEASTSSFPSGLSPPRPRREKRSAELGPDAEDLRLWHGAGGPDRICLLSQPRRTGRRLMAICRARCRLPAATCRGAAPERPRALRLTKLALMPVAGSPDRRIFSYCSMIEIDTEAPHPPFSSRSRCGGLRPRRSSRAGSRRPAMSGLLAFSCTRCGHAQLRSTKDGE